MKPVTIFNSWILSKVSQYLVLAEGCQVDDTQYTDRGAKVTIKDAFGFVYEIEIKTIGRSQTDRSAAPVKPLVERVR